MIFMEKQKEQAIRSFVAIELPDPLQQALGQLQDRIRATGLSAKWSRPENIHLTLKFLGDINPESVAEIGAAMAGAADTVSAMTLYAKSVGVFPSVKRPRVLWTGVAGETEALGRLQKHLEDRFAALGFEKEKRRFAGHFTLARFKGGVDADAVVDVMQQFGDFITDAFVADAIHLFQSRLTPQGPIYSKLKSFPLAPDQG